MRAIIALCAFVFTAAEASEQKMSLDYNYQTDRRPSLLGLSGPAAETTHKETLSYEVTGIADHFDLATRFQILQPDYTHTVLRAEDGTTRSLGLTGNVPKTEYRQELKVAFNAGDFSVRLGGGFHLSRSPFRQEQAEFSIIQGFAAQSTRLQMTAGYLHENQPLTFFTDPYFQTGSRPTSVHVPYARLGLEQIWTPWFKSALECSSSKRIGERPQNFGITLKNGFAPTDFLFTQIWLTQITENVAEPLRNERGYFRMRSAEFIVSSEPFFDWIVSASYAIVVEDETDPRNGMWTRTGSDQLGLVTQYSFKHVDVSLRLAYRLTNDNIHDTEVGGGLTWRL